MNDRLARRLLKGQHRALSNPTGPAALIGASFAALYGTAALRLGDAVSTFLWTVAALVPLAVALSSVRAARRLATLRALALGGLPPTSPNLKAAAREVHGIADAIFKASLQHWVGAALVAAGVLRVLAPQLTAGTLVRVIFLGALFGPVTAMFAYFLVLLRARKTLALLGEVGLTAGELIEAVPPVRRQLRRRLVIFTAISVICPSILTADLAVARNARGLEEAAAAPPAQQRAVVERARSQALVGSAALAGVVLFLSLITAFAAGTAIGRPMQEIAEEARRFAGGKLAAPKLIPAEDEVWAASAAFTEMQGRLASVLTQLRRAGMQIGATTQEIVATSQRYEGGAADQATSLNQTSATTEELARSAAQIAENAGSVAGIASRTLSAAEEGQGSAQAFAASMARMGQDNEAITASVLKLSKRVQQIGRIVEFINGVADKSDLLALNAELEGTKAGEVGRGFQLVASEMRRLAENVIESTKEIEGLIEEIRDATRDAVLATEAGLETTQTSTAVAGSITESLARIVSLAQLTSSAVRAISLATQQQQSGTHQLADAMADILRVTEQNLGATRQVTSANHDLAALAKELQAAVERFEA